MGIIYNNQRFTIYFGDQTDQIYKAAHCVPASAPLLLHERFKPIVHNLALKNICFLNQTHSTQGFLVNDQIPAFDIDGDFLITTKKNLGIGVMAADCLPIAIYDMQHHVAAIVHAGWRGSIAGVAPAAIMKMQEMYNSHTQDLQLFFGPSALPCCYEVKQDFCAVARSTIGLQDGGAGSPFVVSVPVRRSLLAKAGSNHANKSLNIDFVNKALFSRDNKWYLDVPLLNSLQLQKLGIPASAIDTSYNFCTMCDDRFFSHRRQGENAGRQMTVIALRCL